MSSSLMTPQHSRESSTSGSDNAVASCMGNGPFGMNTLQRQQQYAARTSSSTAPFSEPLPILDSQRLQLILAQPINVVQYPTTFGEILAAVSAYGGWQRVSISFDAMTPLSSSVTLWLTRIFP